MLFKKTVFMVDDDKQVNEIVGLILRSRGATVLSATSGTEALDYAKNHPEQIDLLVSDVVMPDMKGPEIARCFSESHPETAVLYLSGYPRKELSRYGLAEDDILVEKPFLADSLIAMAAFVVEQKLSAGCRATQAQAASEQERA